MTDNNKYLIDLLLLHFETSAYCDNLRDVCKIPNKYIQDRCKEENSKKYLLQCRLQHFCQDVRRHLSDRKYSVENKRGIRVEEEDDLEPGWEDTPVTIYIFENHLFSEEEMGGSTQIENCPPPPPDAPPPVRRQDASEDVLVNKCTHKENVTRNAILTITIENPNESSFMWKGGDDARQNVSENSTLINFLTRPSKQELFWIGSISPLASDKLSIVRGARTSDLRWNVNAMYMSELLLRQ